MPIIVGSGGSGTASAGLSNYAELVASIGAWLDRDDLNDMAPDFIKLLESELNRVLRVPEMEAIETLTTSGETATLPTDFLQVRHIYVDDAIRSEVVSSSIANMTRDYSVTAAAARPQLYAIVGDTLYLAPIPSEETDLILYYYQKIPALTSDDDTNWVLLKHPDIYLWGSLLMAELYGWNDDRLPLIRSGFDNAIDQLKKQGVAMRHGGASVFPRPIPRVGARS